MNEFINMLQAKIPEVFDSDDYRAKEGEVHQAFEKKRREYIDELSQEAREQGFILQFSQVGMVIIPGNKGVSQSRSKAGKMKRAIYYPI